MKKVLLLLYTLISINVYGAMSRIGESRLKGTCWKGIEAGFYMGKNKTDNNTYKDSLLLMDVQLNFNNEEVISHIDDEWEIDSTLFYRIWVSKPTNRKSQKVWEKLVKDSRLEASGFEKEFKEIQNQFYNSMQFEVFDDSTLQFAGVPRLKYRIEKDLMFLEFTRGIDNSVTLPTKQGTLKKFDIAPQNNIDLSGTWKYCDGKLLLFKRPDEASIKPDSRTILVKEPNCLLFSTDRLGELANWWVEGNMFCIQQRKALIIKIPYEVSADGQTFRLILKRNHKPAMVNQGNELPSCGKQKKVKYQKSKRNNLMISGIKAGHVKSIDSLCVELGGKKKQSLMDRDTVFLDISTIRNSKKTPKEHSNIGIYEVYDNNTVISILMEIGQKMPSTGILEKFGKLETNYPLYVATADTAEVMACIKANKNLFPADAVPCFLTNGQLVVVKKTEPAPVTQKHISDISVRIDESFSTISITFNEEGKQKFAALSKANIQKMLAIMYGNSLFSSPRVSSEITGGRIEIIGYSHWIDLVKMAISVKAQL